MPSEPGTSINPTPRTTVRRAAQRGVYDRAAIYAIVDEALTCHVGFVDNGQPYVLPMIHARVGDRLYIHGFQGSRMLKSVREGADACITVTLLDGLVLARSAMHHSVNYRSVVILARGEAVTDSNEKACALQATINHVVPGRWEEVREPSDRELAATALVSFPLDEASAKIRSGPPVDDEADYDLSAWAGVIPLRLAAGAPIPDPRLTAGISVPPYATAYSRSE